MGGLPNWQYQPLNFLTERWYLSMRLKHPPKAFRIKQSLKKFIFEKIAERKQIKEDAAKFREITDREKILCGRL